MTVKTEAVYVGGLFRPTADLDLREGQRVRLIVETIDAAGQDREAAIARLKAGIASMRFLLKAPLPSRDEKNERR